MKRTHPLMAVLAATLSAPLAAPAAAQDISSILNPGNFAARLNMGNSPAMAGLPADMGALFAAPNAAVRVNPALSGQIAALTPEISRLAPRTSMAPVPRGGIARIVAPAAAPEAAPAIAAAVAPTRGTNLVEMMADAAEAAPAGANTLVVNGTNTALIQSSPEASAPRLSLWQRLFGG